MVIEDAGTMDIHGSPYMAKGGWPEVVKPVLQWAHSAGYNVEDAPQKLRDDTVTALERLKGKMTQVRGSINIVVSFIVPVRFFSIFDFFPVRFSFCPFFFFFSVNFFLVRFFFFSERFFVFFRPRIFLSGIFCSPFFFQFVFVFNSFFFFSVRFVSLFSLKSFFFSVRRSVSQSVDQRQQVSQPASQTIKPICQSVDQLNQICRSVNQSICV